MVEARAARRLHFVRGTLPLRGAISKGRGSQICATETLAAANSSQDRPEVEAGGTGPTGSVQAKAHAEREPVQ
jgi:hypothetical protein